MDATGAEVCIQMGINAVRPGYVSSNHSELSLAEADPKTAACSCWQAGLVMDHVLTAQRNMCADWLWSTRYSDPVVQVDDKRDYAQGRVAVRYR